ncbi:flagellar basal body rod protein FlgB [Kiloniella antarctica]|uniref:Flagellar basal body rod protein FlgB n=1 Tax=Kiloniella antarctica TaxID=1550907 RepID=A0ABW5BQN8_9PROT
MSDKLKITDVLAKKMDWLTQRQSVLAKNIANSDTLNYVPKDLKDKHFQALVSRSAPVMIQKASREGHLSSDPLKNRNVKAAKSKDLYETSPSGNSVILEEQMIKMSETQLDYQAMVRLYKKHQDMFKMALRGPS